ncbi:coiled-coil domain-containing protein 32 isoform X2 [Carassius gibelio]|uniref:coiled-coil domain-containing protein 32 isoform X2 n=1 Tax=Carassius gibelio TaxID=101364 RepID=UPI002279B07C|nr:coiled-coil domain-containing protein 32 isoform X2 [Carassius gibelio]
MIDDFESHAVRSSGDLWSEICSSLPEPQVQDGGQFTDSFEPSSPGNPQSNSPRASFCPWEPMADSEVYIASLENRLKRIKGQSNEVTSREMLRSLSQAKKECWDRFLHDAQTSELFQEGNFDQRSILPTPECSSIYLYFLQFLTGMVYFRLHNNVSGEGQDSKILAEPHC